jgi:RNA polymerase sigma-70 factor (sigma-E family)
MKAEDDTKFREYAHGRSLVLRRTAYLLCGDWHFAEDLAQTALMKLYRAWPKVRDSVAIDQYVRQILLRSWLDEQRKPWRRKESRDGVVPDREQFDTPQGISEILVAALGRLPAKQRAAVVLRYCQDLPISEVAAALRCSEGTVKSQTSRGLETLRAVVTRLEMAEGSL